MPLHAPAYILASTQPDHGSIRLESLADRGLSRLCADY